MFVVIGGVWSGALEGLQYYKGLGDRSPPAGFKGGALVGSLGIS